MSSPDALADRLSTLSTRDAREIDDAGEAAAARNQAERNRVDVLLKSAKELARSGELTASLACLHRAYAIQPSEKVSRYIAKVEAVLAEHEGGQSSEEEENEGEVDGDEEEEKDDNNVARETNFPISESNDREHIHEQIEGRDQKDFSKSAENIPANLCISDVTWRSLYSHQQEGVLWLWQLHHENKGGILADDMGLGKTIQMSVYLSSVIRSGRVRAALVLAPVSVLPNWQQELHKWCPSLRVGTFHGTSRRQRQLELQKVLKRGGVCLTTYGMVTSNMDELTDEGSFLWDCVVLDEGHKIRNSNKTTSCIFKLQAKQRLILTGTPLMNRLEEMWRLFDFVCKGQLLGSLPHFKSTYSSRIVRCHAKDASSAEQDAGEKLSAELHKLIAPYMLRRTKAEVMAEQLKGNVEKLQEKVAPVCDGMVKTVSETSLIENSTSGDKDNDTCGGDRCQPVATNGGCLSMQQLRRKTDFVVWTHLSDEQLRLYLNFVSGEEVEEALMMAQNPLTKLVLLKKICDHPLLLSDAEQDRLNPETGRSTDLMGDYVEPSDEESNVTTTTVSTKPWLLSDVNQMVHLSGKLQVLVPLIEQLQQHGHRTLIFSQMRKMLDIIEAVLKAKCVKMLRLDGMVRTTAERQQILDKFSTNRGYSCFLLTTQVGGVGLNITAADRVIIFDPSWNPAVDAQAVDRVYRIGQERSVVVYRLITCGTVEEKIYRKQVFKDSLSQQMTGDSARPLRYFTSHEYRNLFVLDNPWLSSTQQRLAQFEEDRHNPADQMSPETTSLQRHRNFLSSLAIAGISEHHLQHIGGEDDFDDDADEDASDHQKALLSQARRYESYGQWKLALRNYLRALKINNSDKMLQFRVIQLAVQLGIWPRN